MLDYSKQYEEAVSLANDLRLDFGRPDNIIFAGMGGSGISGYLVKDVVRDSLDIPIEVSGNYNLPAYAGNRSLFVCTSYSGNTEETLSQFVEAVKRKCYVLSITSGGKLLEWSRRLNIPFMQLPTGYQPRDALPYLFFSLTTCLEKLGLVAFSEDVKELLAVLPEIGLSPIDRMAIEIKDSIPVIYGPSEFSGVLRRIKSQINENGKMLAKSEELPELNHNEVVGYEIRSYPVSVIFLRDSRERPEMRRRVEITKGIVDGKVDGIYDMWARGNSMLTRVMSLVGQGDYLSFRLAEIRNVDRENVKTIDQVKEGLRPLGTLEKLEKELGFIS